MSSTIPTILTVSQSDQGMQCKAKSGEEAQLTYWSMSIPSPILTLQCALQRIVTR